MQAHDVGGRLNRRGFVGGLAGLGASAVGLVLTGGCGFRLGASAGPKVARVGMLSFGSFPNEVATVRRWLRGYGWVEGQDLSVELRDPDPPTTDPAVLMEVARDLVNLPVDVILTTGTAATQASQLATDRVPIVFVMDDPVGRGIVPSLAHPGGNATGVVNLAGSGLMGKRLELLVKLIPQLRRVAYLSNSGNPAYGPSMGALQSAAMTLDVEARSFDVRSVDDLEPAFAAMKAWPADGVLYAGGEPLGSLKERGGSLAAQYRLPTFALSDSSFVSGMLGYYVPQYDNIWEIYTGKVDRILRGTPPAELPVELPRRFDFVVSRSTVRALGLTPAPEVLAEVTQFIE